MKRIEHKVPYLKFGYVFPENCFILFSNASFRFSCGDQSQLFTDMPAMCCHIVFRLAEQSANFPQFFPLQYQRQISRSDGESSGKASAIRSICVCFLVR